MTTTTCSVKLLNKTYDIKCPAHETANLRLAAEKLNVKLHANKKKFKNLDDFQNFLLAALHTTYELVSCQKQQEEQRHQVTQFINILENKINHPEQTVMDLDPETD